MSPRPRSAVLVFGMKARRIGGIEVHTRELVRRLTSSGWHVVLCFHAPPAPAVREYLSSPNVTWEVHPGAWGNSREAVLGLFRILRRHRPRLLHLQFTPFLSLNAWVARLTGVRTIVFTDHGSHPEGSAPTQEPFWRRVAGRFLSFPISLAVAVSEYNRRVIEAQGTFRLSRLHRVYNGVDLTRDSGASDAAGIAFRERYGIPPERIVVMQISQMIPEKGIPEVLEAARLALPRCADLHFVFAGDGKYLEEYRRRLAEIGLGDRVTWTGLVIDPVAEGVFAAADIVCLASRWQEAFGLVIAEAMACQKPVVATRVGAIPELVEEGKTGFLVAAGDAAALADRFVLLAQDRALRLCMGLAGRARAAEFFDVRTNVGQLLGLYGEP